MFGNKKFNERIDRAIGALLVEIEDYDELLPVERVEIKEKIEWYESLRRPDTFDPNTVLLVGANLLGIILIINHERVGVVSSKALGFVMKGR